MVLYEFKSQFVSPCILYVSTGINLFSGTIPTELGNMTSMLHLGLVTCALTGQIPTSVSGLTNLQSITIANNQLSGSFPIFLAEHVSLVNIQLFGNNMVGSLPPFTQERLAVLQLQNNLFSGDLTHVFTESFVSSSALNTIDLSQNTFTSSIPPALFNVPALWNLALSSNCFTGSLPHTICNARIIQTMSLNGLSSNSRCDDQGPILDFFLKEYVYGSLPSCVWQMPNLNSFHVSGNRFSGEIGDLLWNSRLEDLSLRSNHFTGSLPLSLQRQSYSTLDVSYNTFTGSINDIFNVSDSLRTEMNRFSGRLSGIFSRMEGVEMHILRGNMFECDNIPSADEASDTYACGSSNLDNALYFVSGSVLLWLIILAVISVYHFGKYKFSYTITKFLEYYFFFDAIDVVDSSSPNIVKFEWMLRKTVYSLCLCSVLGMLVCIPIFIMKISYGADSYDDSYTWILSLAYSSGMFVGIFVLLAWMSLLMAGMFLTVLFMKIRKKYELKDEMSVKKENNDHASSKIRVTLSGVSMNIARSHYALILLSLNGIVVIGANALYVYSIFLEFSSVIIVFIQISFAIFTLFWKYVVMSHFVFNPTETLARRVMFRAMMDMFSVVIAPILVQLVTAPDCFGVSTMIIFFLM